MGRSRLPKQPDKGQKKITQFFIRPQSDSGNTNNSNSSQSSSSTSAASSTASRPRPHPRPRWIDDGDYSEVEVLERPPSPPKELIDLISSSSDENEDGNDDKISKCTIKIEPETTPSKLTSSAADNSIPTSSPPPPPVALVNENSNDSVFSGSSSGDEVLSQVDVDEIVKSSQENKSGEIAEAPNSDPFNEGNSSSGDEVLSQIDVDEIIRSSQNSVNSCQDDNEDSGRSLSPSILSTPNKENHLIFPVPRMSSSETCELSQSDSTFKSPKKISPKSQLTKFSPRRHLPMKRTSSEASLDSSSTSVYASTKSPSPSSKSKFENVSTRSNSQSPTKRKLDFNIPAIASGGQARYFLRNFINILSEVISDKFHAHLIHPEDHRLAQDFITLSIDAQHLYVRLFQRKWLWRPVNKLNNNNKELPQDLTEACAELCSKGFLDEISLTNCGSLEDVLDVLDLGKLASLTKKMMLNPGKKTKEAFKSALLSSRKNQKTLTGIGSSGSTSIILKHALAELGPAFRVSSNSKLMFSRLFLLHSPPQYWEVENDQASNQLLIVLLNQMGQMEYPTYTIQKTTVVYPTRNHLIQFHEAFSLHSNLVAFTEAKEWAEVVTLATHAKVSLENILSEESTQEHDTALPSFLKIYTAGSVLTHTLWLGVDGFQKLKKFREANELIRFLLDQLVYLKNYRGRWWERLIINTETHLKKSKVEVKNLLEEALKDAHLKENHRLTLSQRLEKIVIAIEKVSKKKVPPPKTKAKPTRKMARKTTSRRRQYIDESDDETSEEEPTSRYFESDDIETQVIDLSDHKVPNEVETLSLKHECPTRTITGEKLDQGPGATGKSVFISRKDSTGSNRLGSVEQFVIDYYLDNHGYTCGIHGEGSTIATVYGLLFWDVIFSDGIPDAFHHRYQPFPLDLHFEDFYNRRKHLIDEKLTLIRTVLAMEDLFGIVDEIWAKNEKKLSIVNWSMFEDNIERLKSLMKAMGKKMIADICERLAKNYRHYSSGFPDLVVWKDIDPGDEDLFAEGGENSCDSFGNSVQQSNGKVLFVEVKGPGDHLSEKQQLWLDFLLEKGIPAEVCLVKAVSNKRIRLSK